MKVFIFVEPALKGSDSNKASSVALGGSSSVTDWREAGSNSLQVVVVVLMQVVRIDFGCAKSDEIQTRARQFYRLTCSDCNGYLRSASPTTVATMRNVMVASGAMVPLLWAGSASLACRTSPGSNWHPLMSTSR